MQEIMKKRALELLSDGTVNRVIGWEIDTPAIFESAEDVEKRFEYSEFSAANLSKYLVAENSKEGKTLVFLKPCDTYSLNQLITEHRVSREKVYVIGIECHGKVDAAKLKACGIKSLASVKVNEGEVVVVDAKGNETKMPYENAVIERCVNCKSRKPVIYDELIGQAGEVIDSDRFDMVEKLEKMTSAERFDFWQGELSKCIRCNACRKACPACTCEHCVFDNDASGIASKANADSFEEKMYHIIRAFHVAGRCTDCGECSRVCPQNIPLHLINRKYIKDINEFYGEYQAGEDTTSKAPLTNYKLDDIEPGANLKEGK